MQIQKNTRRTNYSTRAKARTVTKTKKNPMSNNMQCWITVTDCNYSTRAEAKTRYEQRKKAKTTSSAKEEKKTQEQQQQQQQQQINQ